MDVSRAVQLPLPFFVCVLVIALMIPCACAGEPADTILSRTSGEPGTGLFASPAGDLNLPLFLPGGISSSVITGPLGNNSGSCSDGGYGIVPTTPARTAADPFSVIDTQLPPAEASALKARIQETLHAFSYDGTTGSWYARNTANQITFTYTTVNGTATFSGPGTGPALSLTLAGLGREDTFTPVGRGVATASGRELFITRQAYTEWYRNNDTGIEQGMTITSRPPGNGPLQVRFGLAGNVTRSGSDGMTLSITDTSGEPLLTYTGLHAVSADGAELPVSLTTGGTSLSWVVDDTDAVYPVTIDPVVSASAAAAWFAGGGDSDYFGNSVALSSDGSTALVGAQSNDTAGSDAGAAYIFVKPGGGWSSKTANEADAQFTGAAGSNRFGSSVALSSNGSTALVGASEAGGGAAYIFLKPGGGWSSRSASAADARFTYGGDGDKFGNSVALSSDGSTALVGAYSNNTVAEDAGAAYIFVKPGGGWSNRSADEADARFTGGTDHDYFGYSVALSPDGLTALIGAHRNKTAGSEFGAAYIFAKPGGGWSSKTADEADAWFTGGASGDTFGYSVMLSSDGSTALVGAYNNDTAGLNAGAAYIFEKGGGWSSRSASAADARFTGGAGDNYFGVSVALSPDGSTALVGATNNQTAGSNAGAAYRFRKGGGWSSKTADEADTQFTGTVNEYFGNSVALSSDSSTALVGASNNDTAGSNAGAAYIYFSAVAPTITGISPASGTTAGGTSVTITGTGFTGATAVKFGATNATSYTVNSATQITAVSPAGSAGTVDITVTTSAGTSATGAADRFTYSSPTPTPTPTPAPAGNGGSDSAAGSSGSTAVSTVTGIVAGQPATFSFDQNPTVNSPVTLNDVQIVFNQNQGSVEMIGGTVSYGGSLPGQTVVGFITIELVGLNPNLVNGATIFFSVNGQYLRDHHLDPAQVTLMRNHDGQWSPLEGSLVGQTGDTYHYEAQTPGFSQFAVVVSHPGIVANTTAVPLRNSTIILDQGVTPASATVPATMPVAGSTVTSVPLTTATTVVPAAPATNPGIPVIVIEGIVALGAVIGGICLIRRWWIRRQNPALFKEM